jgi:hypothetical protein
MTRTSRRGSNVTPFINSRRRASILDPAIAAIESYWNALEIWRVADRRLKRLRKKLPDDVTRLPRVQVAFLLRGKDEKGADIREPIYVHSEWALKDRIQKDCKSQLSFWAGPSFVYDPTTKGSFRKILTETSKKQRPIIKAKYRLREKTKLEEFRADREALYSRQRAVGWRQAVEAEEEAKRCVSNLRYRAQSTKPTTVAGALALIEFINAAYRTKTRCRDEGAPYGLGPYYSAHIARNVAQFLRNPHAVKMRRAA